MSKGHLVAEGSVDKLGREAVGGGTYRVEVKTVQADPRLVELIERIDGVVSVQASGESLVINCTKDLRPQVAKMIVDSGSLLTEMKIEQYGLEQIYMKYFKEG